MRQILIAMTIATGFGLAMTSPTLSAPLNGSVLGDVARSESPVEAARWSRSCRHWRHSRRTCWRRWRRG
jgi:PhoPQ-activated pathogenicity-related protein